MIKASREGSQFTHLTHWGFGEAETEEEAVKARHIITYGQPQWPSHCIWLVPDPTRK